MPVSASFWSCRACRRSCPCVSRVGLPSQRRGRGAGGRGDLLQAQDEGPGVCQTPCALLADWWPGGFGGMGEGVQCAFPGHFRLSPGEGLKDWPGANASLASFRRQASPVNDRHVPPRMPSWHASAVQVARPPPRPQEEPLLHAWLEGVRRPCRRSGTAQDRPWDAGQRLACMAFSPRSVSHWSASVPDSLRITPALPGVSRGVRRARTASAQAMLPTGIRFPGTERPGPQCRQAPRAFPAPFSACRNRHRAPCSSLGAAACRLP